ncbi:MAG: gliding motility-associated C-terminal domain-containing protein [Bacteroidaceae bacterium]|nr:gliding motility-associated C-terminal domain-containing protein [Bacteroidaceae bacterium]
MSRLNLRISIILVTLFICQSISTYAQSVSPIVYYIDTTTETGDTVTMNPGDSQTGQAPLELNCKAELDVPDGWEATCEWKIFSNTEGESSPLVTRFEENTSYTLTSSGGYGIKLYVTFTNTSDGSTDEYESDVFSVVISESELTCPNAFSPNDDGKNDVLRVSCKSIVKLEALIFNRRGQKLASKKVNGTNGGYTENGTYYIDLWDGRYGGDYVRDGVYFLNLVAEGSDGIVYKEKKAINVLKGYNEDTETSGN